MNLDTLEIPYTIDGEGALCHTMHPDGGPRGTISIMSFGILHGFPALAEAYLINLTRALHNPYRDPRMRDLTAFDGEVYDRVMATEGALGLSVRSAAHLLRAAEDAGSRAAEFEIDPVPVNALTCCKGGRHRAPSMAWSIGVQLWREGFTVHLRHRDILRDVVKVPAGA